MTSRREFLQIGVTVSSWPFASSMIGAAGADRPGADRLGLYKVIYDSRFVEGTAFAARAGALGLPVHAIEGDMTRFWYDDLYYRWKHSPAAVAGLTAHGPMFCFEQLARDQGMRVVFRGQHKFGPAGDVEHELVGPSSMLQDCLVLNGWGGDWAACMADVVAHCPQGRAELSRAAATSPERPRPAAQGSESLYSWVIAPPVKT